MVSGLQEEREIRQCEEVVRSAINTDQALMAMVTASLAEREAGVPFLTVEELKHKLGRTDTRGSGPQ